MERKIISASTAGVERSIGVASRYGNNGFIEGVAGMVAKGMAGNWGGLLADGAQLASNVLSRNYSHRTFLQRVKDGFLKYHDTANRLSQAPHYGGPIIVQHNDIGPQPLPQADTGMNFRALSGGSSDHSIMSFNQKTDRRNVNPLLHPLGAAVIRTGEYKTFATPICSTSHFLRDYAEKKNMKIAENRVKNGCPKTLDDDRTLAKNLPAPEM